MLTLLNQMSAILLAQEVWLYSSRNSLPSNLRVFLKTCILTVSKQTLNDPLVELSNLFAVVPWSRPVHLEAGLLPFFKLKRVNRNKDMSEKNEPKDGEKRQAGRPPEREVRLIPDTPENIAKSLFGIQSDNPNLDELRGTKD
ncbi:MAG: hypothetical protein OXG39_05415 [Chloroflexi bacterium]|nr:hypothetical protein [Chloroflexota bacterium]